MAGWYPDPAGVAALRWWDGHSWTGWVCARPKPLYGRASIGSVWAVSAGLSALLLLASVAALHSDDHKLSLHEDLARHSVAVVGTVLKVSYDPDGGDPGGWTSELVSYDLPGLGSHRIELGHHYPPTVKVGSPISLVADSRRPSVADLPNFDLGELRADVSDSKVFVEMTGALTVGTAAGLGHWLQMRRKRRVLADSGP